MVIELHTYDFRLLCDCVFRLLLNETASEAEAFFFQCSALLNEDDHRHTTPSHIPQHYQGLCIPRHHKEYHPTVSNTASNKQRVAL